MSANPNVEKAQEAIYATNKPRLEPLEVVQHLDAAGLLVTPLHERALRACEEMSDIRYSDRCLALQHAQAIGRDSIAARQPKERWTAERRAGMTGRWCVRRGDVSCYIAQPDRDLTEAQARAVAAALNALEDK